MITPNTGKTVTTNVKDYLSHMVGQTVVSRIIAEHTGEDLSAVAGALHRLEKEGRLEIEKKVGLQYIYKVLPAISKPRQGDNRSRPPKYARSGASKPAFKVESGVKMPEPEPTYPFHKMAVGDSFKFPAESDKEIDKVWAVATNYGKRHKQEFAVHRRGKKSARCWRTK